MVLNLSCTDTFGVQGDDLIFNASYILLVLLHNNGLELTHPIPWNYNFLLSVFADHRLLALAISAIWRHLGFDLVLLVA